MSIWSLFRELEVILMTKITALIRKEWKEVFNNKFVIFTVSFLPLVLTILPLGIVYFMVVSGDLANAGLGDLPPGFAPLCGNLESGDCLIYAMVSQFILLFMMVPVIVPMTIASYSIVGEKNTRTLEPLLATPVTTFELLVGKGLAGVIPAVLATWGGYLIFALGLRLLVPNPAVTSRLFDPLWLAAVLIVSPLLSLLGVSIAVMISSRVNDPRVAEQISGVFVVPVLALFFGQTTGLFLVNERFILWMAGILLVLDLILFSAAVRVFQRETILSRWK
jgi:ABC-2 type transport system permease protein